MKRDSLVDAAVVGVLGSVLAFFNTGLVAAEGLILGAAAGGIYLLLLHLDVDRLGAAGPGEPRRTPLDVLNPLRLVRLLVPLALVAALAAQEALTAAGGLEAWWANVRWEPGANFVGLVPAESLYAGLLGYIAVILSLQLRGLSKSVPEAGGFFQIMPGSFGVASKMVKEAKKNEADVKKAQQGRGPAAKRLPILLVSGPRGVGKSTLVRRLLQADPRFREPEWIATAECDAGSGADAKQTIFSDSDFEALRDSGSLAVSYRPYDEEGEQVDLGLPALSVIAAAQEGGACVLDVDPPTARQLLSYNWDRALGAVCPGEDVELNFVSVWVSLSSLEKIMERNKRRLEADSPKSGEAAIERQLAPLRSQASSDIEWALTSRCFDFTLINEDQDESAEELERDAQYCFGDPF